MQNVPLSICKVVELGNNKVSISVPYWIPTNVLTKVNDQKYHEFILPSSSIKDGFISSNDMESELSKIDSRNPYKYLRAKNPQIKDYRRLNMGQFAPKKQVVKIDSFELEGIRNSIIFATVTDYNKDFSVYYKSK